MFIGRRADNSIYGAWSVRQWPEQEELADDNPELVAFLAPKPPLTFPEPEKSTPFSNENDT
jgi:hypothetical protein